MKNLGNLMRQAQEMQGKMAEMQDRLAAMEIEGSSGGGMVKVTLNGKGEMRKLHLEPSLCMPEESQVLEDLIIAAHNDAKNKVETHAQEEMSKLTGGLNLPGGFKLPF